MTDKLQGFDMVAAITQASVNTQFYELYNTTDPGGHYIIKRELDINLKESGIELTGIIGGPEQGGPWVEFGIPGSPRAALFYLPISSGSLKHWVIEDGQPVQKEIDFTGLIYAFKVNLDFAGIRQEDIKNKMQIPPVVKQHLEHFTDDLFTVRALFTDFENADISSYDKAKSTIPEALNNVKGITDFQSAIENYFTSLSGSKNPYILGYAIDSKDPNATGDQPTFVPTGATFSTFNDPHKPDLNALNFLIMTDNSGLPSSPGAGLFAENWVTTNDYDGTFALDSELLFEKWLLPTLKTTLGLNAPSRSGNKWTLSSSTDESEVLADVIPCYPFGVIDFVDFITHTTGGKKLTVTFTNNNESEAEIDISGDIWENVETKYQCVFVHRDWINARLPFSVTVTIKAGTDGQLSFDYDQNIPEPTVISSHDLTIDPILRFIEDLSGRFEEWANQLKSDVNSLAVKVGTSLQGLNTLFIMPGGSVFFFKNPQFNDEGDLLMDISYKTN